MLFVINYLIIVRLRALPASSQDDEMEGDGDCKANEGDMKGADGHEKVDGLVMDKMAGSCTGVERKSSLKLTAIPSGVDGVMDLDNSHSSSSPHPISRAGDDKYDWKEVEKERERKRRCYEREVQRKEEETVNAATLLYCQEHNFLSTSYFPPSLWTHTPTYSPASSYSSLPLMKAGTGTGMGMGVGVDPRPVLLSEKTYSSANISTKNISRAESVNELKTFESGDAIVFSITTPRFILLLIPEW